MIARGIIILHIVKFKLKLMCFKWLKNLFGGEKKSEASEGQVGDATGQSAPDANTEQAGDDTSEEQSQ